MRQFLVNERVERTAVVLGLDEYERLVEAFEELEDQQLATEVGRDVDLVDLASASTVMRAQVIHGGERIYCANEFACETFEDYAYSSYARLNEERRGILQDISRRGSVYG